MMSGASWGWAAARNGRQPIVFPVPFRSSLADRAIPYCHAAVIASVETSTSAGYRCALPSSPASRLPQTFMAFDNHRNASMDPSIHPLEGKEEA